MAWKTGPGGGQIWVPDDPQGASKYGFYTDRDGERWAVDDNYQHWYWNPAEGGWFKAEAGNSPYYTAEGWFDTRPTKEQAAAKAAQEKAAQEAAAAKQKADAAAAQAKLNWETSDPTKRTFKYLDEPQRLYYTKEASDDYYRQFVGFFGGNTDSNRGQYALTKYQQAMADYNALSEGKEDALFPDLLTKEYWDKLSGGFDQLGWRDRGESAPTMNSGRIVW